MERKNVELNEAKYREYMAIREVIKDTIGNEDYTNVCLKNNTLNTMAGYTDASSESNYNPYVKDFIDKLTYDEHNRKVEYAKAQGNKDELKRLSDIVMDMAGYNGQKNKRRINGYAKSFVDRKFVSRELSKLYKAMEQNDEQGVALAYKRIYNMSSYSNTQPFNVVNDCAQGFVDLRLDEFIERGIHIPEVKVKEQNIEYYAI